MYCNEALIGQSPTIIVPLWSTIRDDNHYFDKIDTRGKGAFSIVVAYSKIDGFPQITEKNLDIGKKI